jgi:hypothetical protein
VITSLPASVNAEGYETPWEAAVSRRCAIGLPVEEREIMNSLERDVWDVSWTVVEMTSRRFLQRHA